MEVWIFSGNTVYKLTWHCWEDWVSGKWWWRQCMCWVEKVLVSSKITSLPANHWFESFLVYAFSPAFSVFPPASLQSGVWQDWFLLSWSMKHKNLVWLSSQDNMYIFYSKTLHVLSVNKVHIHTQAYWILIVHFRIRHDRRIKALNAVKYSQIPAREWPVYSSV